MSEETKKRPANTVDAEPTKRFFMEMLTRDIELSDAILDLIDNCIDGVHRITQDKTQNNKSPYNGFFCELKVSKNEFSIKDNCGGIPLTVAKEYAFKLGRDNQNMVDKNIATVGMYGIGMKRAIFKIGNSAEVISRHIDDFFKVSIPSDWISQKGWYFEYSMLKDSEIDKSLKKEGTLIKICDLHENIGSQFGNESGFIKNLSITIRQHYGYIIQQGFRIILNDEDIDALDLSLLTENNDNKSSIKPFVYTNNINGVDIDIIIGFYRPLPSQEELDNADEGYYAPSETENAGITVICNDRIVLYCDRTYTTGWGDTPIPKYHTQFIAIAGVVHFRSKTPLDLPVTTTKRGLNTDAPIYLKIKERIKDGLKLYTGFTNNWKTKSTERDEVFKNTVKFNALAPSFVRSASVVLTPIKSDNDKVALYQIPNLPKPPKAKKTDVAISFRRERDQVEEMRSYFFGTAKKSAGEIGAWCFDEMFSQVE